jgi:hypothetical protein
MSNLIPTPRTDKNGRTVIRHMKDRLLGNQKPTQTIPVVAQPRTGNYHGRVGSIVRYYLLELPNFHVPIPATEDFSKAMGGLNENVPDILVTIERLMSVGTESARKAVALCLLDEVKMAQYGVGDIVVKPKLLESRLLALWNAENVADEAGLSGRLDFRKKSRLIITPEEGYSDAEWRGHAAFRLAFETTKSPCDSGNLIEFIRWAGREKDIAKVIEFARERRTIDPGTIKPLMESSESNSVLRDGLL